jgi:hypothetical protein
MKAASTTGPADEGWTWKSVVAWGCLIPALWLILYALSLASDSTRAATEVAQSKRADAVMVCNDGVIVYRDDSMLHKLTGHLFDKGSFMCTDWRMREVGSLR